MSRKAIRWGVDMTTKVEGCGEVKLGEIIDEEVGGGGDVGS